ncbi:MAG TPA: TetR/AcrR family transcriptional regulator [Pseudonocardiaceae bacterium]|nr:TetR/AcrR family transcriptional regulator [Pseudonocardiaceae bacterium]
MTQPRRARYHHGDLKAELVRSAIELIGERGVTGFSMAQLTRRLGVAPSAPYAHFADRDALLAAVVVHGYQVFHAELAPELATVSAPRDRIAAMARAYVRFAAAHDALFDVLYHAGVDKVAHPSVAEAERPITDAFAGCVTALGGDDRLATAVEATAHGYAMLLRGGDFDGYDSAVREAADGAARAVLALVDGWGQLRCR